MSRRANLEEHWGNIFQTCPGIRVVYWHGLFRESEHFFLKIITDIQYPCNEYMHIIYITVDYSWSNIFYWTIRLLKVNYLNLRTTICTVERNKFPCIRTFTFFNTCINTRMEDISSIRQVFDCYVSHNKVNTFFLVVLYKYIFFPELSLRIFMSISNILGVRGFLGD